MILLGYLLWLAVVVWVARRAAQRVQRGRKTQLLVGWGAGIVAAMLPYWDIVLGLPVTVDSCINRAGLHVHENVIFPLRSVHWVAETSPSDVCQDCKQLLFRQIAGEVQFNVTPSSGRSPRTGSLVNRPGPVRYWISEVGDPNCAEYLRAYATADQRRRDWEQFGVAYRDGRCLAAQPVSKITAEYRLSLSAPTEQRGVVTLHVREVQLTRVSDGAVIASLSHVRQYPWTAKRFFYGLPPIPSCPLLPVRDPMTGKRLGNSFSQMALVNQLVENADRQGAIP